MKSFKQFVSESLDISNNPNFWKWFDDSKVVDNQGNPLVVYHGSGAMFDTFDKDRIGQNYGESHGGSRGHGGFFFTTRKSTADYYASGHSTDTRTIEAYLSIQRPFIKEVPDYSYVGDGMDMGVDFESLREKGFDGVMVTSHQGSFIAAFEPTQIKSATDNNGDFNPNNPDITK
jgi:hypothetical protein